MSEAMDTAKKLIWACRRHDVYWLKLSTCILESSDNGFGNERYGHCAFTSSGQKFFKNYEQAMIEEIGTTGVIALHKFSGLENEDCWKEFYQTWNCAENERMFFDWIVLFINNINEGVETTKFVHDGIPKSKKPITDEYINNHKIIGGIPFRSGQAICIANMATLNQKPPPKPEKPRKKYSGNSNFHDDSQN